MLLGGAKSLAHGVRVRLHHGTRSTNARVRMFDREELSPGESTYARLRLEEPLILLPGDRFVLRSLAPQVTIGGGTGLDPAPAGRRAASGWVGAPQRKDGAPAPPLVLAPAPTTGLTSAGVGPAL